jgi:protein tyrosine phosphatase (PTP) superfamily phosphohydrolase (DUF442 family)
MGKARMAIAQNDPNTAETLPSKRKPPRPWRWLLLGAVLPISLVGAEAGHIFWNGNVHALLPGRVYRCAQPSPESLRRLVEEHDIRTVVNLRGCCEGFAWYDAECRATQQLDLSQEDVCMSAGRMPSPQAVRRLIEVLDRSTYPLLLHCRRGADRTGLASTVVLLLQPDVSLSQARGQMGLRYGHLALGRPAELDRFFDLYQDWLHRQDLEHDPEHFRRWALNDYTAGETIARLEWLEKPGQVRPGEPFAARLRATNTSALPWRMSQSLTAGVHVCFLVWDDKGEQVAGGKAGLFEAEVAPGASVNVTVPLPGLSRPGRYRLFVDLIDERRCLFFQTGSELLEGEFIVRE